MSQGAGCKKRSQLWMTASEPKMRQARSRARAALLSQCLGGRGLRGSANEVARARAWRVANTGGRSAGLWASAHFRAAGCGILHMRLFRLALGSSGAPRTSRSSGLWLFRERSLKHARMLGMLRQLQQGLYMRMWNIRLRKLRRLRPPGCRTIRALTVSAAFLHSNHWGHLSGPKAFT